MATKGKKGTLAKVGGAVSGAAKTVAKKADEYVVKPVGKALGVKGAKKSAAKKAAGTKAAKGKTSKAASSKKAGTKKAGSAKKKTAARRTTGSK